ncbi:hypothetical protein IV203_036735 [Nitzschia inconspicua]|uniref:PNPLA domain-containing protein n=1 Tax=Nitzschia inconspicua TaxID=303405 RepID=A0A9K3PY95_9STRA|nr:hypothetical protein IV203_036735 [Nitzschia inconspicua]
MKPSSTTRLAVPPARRTTIRLASFLLLFIAELSFHMTYVDSLIYPLRTITRTRYDDQHSKLLVQSTAPVDTSTKDLIPTIVEETETPSPHIIFPGGGIFFYYQAGLVHFLRENKYDLSNCTFAGASAGALTASLTATDVDFYEATDLALSMAAKAGVWDRSSGLQGIWGPMIEDWLDTLLPPSIESIQGKVTLLVTPVPSFGKTKISHFVDRTDLIQCNIASVHLPWFLNGKWTSNFRNQPHIDGSFLSKTQDYFPPASQSRPTIVLDWKEDPKMRARGGLDIVEALTPDGIYGLLDQGRVYGKIMEERGIFETLKKT